MLPLEVFERYKERTDKNLEKLNEKLKKKSDIAGIQKIMTGFEGQLQRQLTQTKTISQDHAEYVKNMVVTGSEQKFGDEGLVAIKLLEVSLKGQILKLE